MTEWVFDIFGDRLARESTRSLPRQPLSNNENFGKSVTTGPIKPNEPLKKAGELKKSFLSNTGKAFGDIQTPIQKVYSPRFRNIDSTAKKSVCSQLIYSDEIDEETRNYYESLEFTKPTYKYNNYHTDLVDYLVGPEPRLLEPPSPTTPPPVGVARSVELDCSYEDDFFKDDFSNGNDSSPFEEDAFPVLYEDSD